MHYLVFGELNGICWMADAVFCLKYEEIERDVPPNAAQGLKIGIKREREKMNQTRLL